ncbi:DUF2567 domain-containing protein [Motilibacter deserti]|uniref:DUF2567 domain-containing protein n=1 Tax=Motilibacter deserti TaxID=2714956 RepID=A0ABX0GRD5_9ACTN|nr:DUF2567 domain-containing protein [Motilibacter deserti]NHC12254.1 DUF2567 domain-containing protein [Motilibacter deserti]
MAGLRAAAVVALGSALVGLLAGAAWQWVAPQVEGTVTADGIVPDPTPAVFGAEAWFACVAIVAGVLCALLAFVRFGRTGSYALLGLVLGGLLGSAVAWQAGSRLGPGELSADGHAVGERVIAALDLHAYGVLLCWPIAATVIFFALTAGFGVDDPPAGDGRARAAGPHEPGRHGRRRVGERPSGT